MHFLYILYSEKFDLFYVGQTHDMAQRVERHNNHIYKGAFTKIDENWKSVLELQRFSAMSSREFQNLTFQFSKDVWFIHLLLA